MPDDYKAFHDWVVGTYGHRTWVRLMNAPGNYRDQPLYGVWLSQQRPAAPEDKMPWYTPPSQDTISTTTMQGGDLPYAWPTPEDFEVASVISPTGAVPSTEEGVFVPPEWYEAKYDDNGVLLGYIDQKTRRAYDPDGNPTHPDMLFPPRDTDMDEYQQAAADLAREQFEWQKAQYGQGDEDAFDEQKEFELWKAQKQLEWSQPDVRSRNWIKRWLLEQEKGPAFGPEAVGYGSEWLRDEIGKQTAEVSRLAEILKGTKGLATLPGAGREGEDYDVRFVQEQYNNALTHLNNLYRSMEGLANKPMLPSAPGWLANMTGMQTGAPISAAPITTPSGQSFSKMPFEQRQQLAGYADWASAGGKTRSYRDILDTMAMMQPNDPRIAYNWQPARQRT